MAGQLYIPMVGIDIVVDETGILRACSAAGHAGAGETGADIVCAAVSVLMRTMVRVLSDRKGISIRSAAPEPGFVRLETEYTAEGREFLSACGDFFFFGLRSVAEEFPENCRIIVTERRTLE
jgi:uncharacterized protein YsxB (DUF464 family)